MKKKTLSLISLLLTLVMLVGVFAACKSKEETTQKGTETPTESSEESKNTETEETATTTTTEGTTESTEISIENIENGALIENAYTLANGVNAYFTNGKRTDFALENQNMSLEYALASFKQQQVTSLKNPAGKVYIENTADVYVKTTSGNVFYASDSSRAATANLYRFGYYYYEARFEEQLFNGQIKVEKELPVSLEGVGRTQVKTATDKDGSLLVTLTGTTDPYITFKGINVNADDYNYVKVSLKTDSTQMRSLSFYVKAGSATGFSDDQAKYFTISPTEDYMTYYVPLSALKDYTGKVTGLRLDFSGTKGMTYNIKEVAFVKGDDGNPPMDLGLNRSFLVYSDKLHHYLQIASADVATANLAEVGMETKIDANTVAKLIIKDKNGTHESLDGVDFDTVEYVGFDIKDAGIFGYILPADNSGGKLTVTLKDGIYTVIQSRTPENNTIKPSGKYNEETQQYDPLVPLNGNDFYMGQRIYTDATHDFSTFLTEAKLERNPLTDKNIVVDAEKSTGASFGGYDALRGIYTFHVDGDGFNGPFFMYPNKYYNVKFNIKGDDSDRKIYIMTLTDEGCLECAVLLDGKNMMLPLPIEVGKNFSEGNGERNLWNIEDDTYGEAILPMVIKAGSKQSYNFLNLYQNWGQYPLKQVSWIQYYAPYYHLSTGVTETNCIVPYYSCKNARGLATLPDHRAMSAPLWAGQPQHNSGGSHRWLCYTDADGNFIASENTKDTIDSYGPTYADVIMDYLTDDGKIKVNYIHTEFPQTDENRAYYEMKYEVLDDVSIKNFSENFYFYRVTDNDPTGVYQNVGYLNEQNKSVVVNSVADGEVKKYILGDNCPYFSFFNMKDYTSDSAEGYTNLSFLIYNSSFVINGKKITPKFVIINEVIDGSNYVRLSLDLGDVTLKKGDTFEINAIVMPWGSQSSKYEAGKEDQNVRDVRENSLLNPLTITAGKNCERIESVFVPRAKTTDGKSAEFTLTGGQNNVAVRIYGFEKLTAPVIEELVDGKWVPYNVSSAYAPDVQGNAHYFDGYCVYYDMDGTFSYSFIVEQDYTDKDGRTFRITAAEDFKSWPNKLPEIGTEDIDLPLNVYQTADDLSGAATISGLFGSTEIKENGAYVDLTPKPGSRESYFIAYPGGTLDSTGQYFVMKYRLPNSNPNNITDVEIFTSTVSTGAQSSDTFSIGKAMINDGEWQIVIVDLASWQKASFVADSEGKYKVKYLRLDPFNENIPSENHFEIAFIGISDNLEDIYKLSLNMEYVSLLARKDGASVVTAIDPITGKEIAGTGGGSTESKPTEPDKTETNPPSTDVVEDAVSGVSGYNVHLNATALATASESAGTGHLGTKELMEGGKYVRFNICTDANRSEANRQESYFKAYAPTEKKATGQYLVLKYRAPEQIGSLQFYTSTEKTGAAESNAFTLYGPDGTKNQCFIGDNEWHIVIVDLSKVDKEYTADANGKFVPNFLRIDLFNLGKPLDAGQTTYVDLAYFCITDNYEEILGTDTTVENVLFCDGTTVSTIPNTAK